MPKKKSSRSMSLVTPVLVLLLLLISSLTVLNGRTTYTHTYTDRDTDRQRDTLHQHVYTDRGAAYTGYGNTSSPSPAPTPVVREEPQPPTLILPSSVLLSNSGLYKVHFIHIPKCGGTSMTAILRQTMCAVDPVKHKDCCTNPGFCDHSAKRKCAAIKGCINHFPNRDFIFRRMPTVTILREPVSRLVSAWFYRGHSPNNDFFQVRPEFREIKFGQRPKVNFEDYLGMLEYNNIQTRMLGADSFPYRNITITEEIFEKAVEALNQIYFVGLQEAYELSVELMLRELGTNIKLPVKKERQQTSQQMKAKKAAVTGNETLMKMARSVNTYDYRLYDLGKSRFCRTISKYPDLVVKLHQTKVVC